MCRKCACSVYATMLLMCVVNWGCSGLESYSRKRVSDLLDLAPISFRYGVGISASMSASPFLVTGLGWRDNFSIGSGDGRWGWTWRESALYALIFCGESQSLDCEAATWGYSEPFLFPRISVLPRKGPLDHRYAVPNMMSDDFRLLGSCFVFVPAAMGPDGPVFAILPPVHSWANIQGEVFLGVIGVRVGVCVDEMFDFVLGLFGLDPIGDDDEVESKSDQASQSVPEPIKHSR